jgi:hypothetical protein
MEEIEENLGYNQEYLIIYPATKTVIMFIYEKMGFEK